MALTAAAKTMTERYFMVIEVVDRDSVEGVWIICFGYSAICTNECSYEDRSMYLSCDGEKEWESGRRLMPFYACIAICSE
jgi:hypothetical protein